MNKYNSKLEANCAELLQWQSDNRNKYLITKYLNPAAVIATITKSQNHV